MQQGLHRLAGAVRALVWLRRTHLGHHRQQYPRLVYPLTRFPGNRYPGPAVFFVHRAPAETAGVASRCPYAWERWTQLTEKGPRVELNAGWRHVLILGAVESGQSSQMSRIRAASISRERA